MLLSACIWLTGRLGGNQSFYEQAIQKAVRSWDPFQKIEGAWLLRRLSPESNPIEIADLSKRRDEERLLHVMGSEAANVHLGSRHALANIWKDLRRRKAGWLRSAARDMAKVTEKDWKKYWRPEHGATDLASQKLCSQPACA